MVFYVPRSVLKFSRTTHSRVTTATSSPFTRRNPDRCCFLGPSLVLAVHNISLLGTVRRTVIRLRPSESEVSESEPSPSFWDRRCFLFFAISFSVVAARRHGPIGSLIFVILFLSPFSLCNRTPPHASLLRQSLIAWSRSSSMLIKEYRIKFFSLSKFEIWSDLKSF